MFSGWGIDLRNENLALLATGLVVAGLTVGVACDLPLPDARLGHGRRDTR